ncbi:MAG TPA: hypothetical protein DDY43_13415 [Synechococcales bacterium UBA10510]|nr:hypothetical protein [Synechococcales bacterium UBA10510]
MPGESQASLCFSCHQIGEIWDFRAALRHLVFTIAIFIVRIFGITILGVAIFSVAIFSIMF